MREQKTIQAERASDFRIIRPVPTQPCQHRLSCKHRPRLIIPAETKTRWTPSLTRFRFICPR